MKQARIEWQGQVRDVLVDERDQVRLNDGTVLKEGEFRWLPPADGTLVALGLNYADHASELEFKPPTEPLVFIKAPNTFIGHQQQSVRPTPASRCAPAPAYVFSPTVSRRSKTRLSQKESWHETGTH